MVFFSIVDNHHDLALLETDNLAVSSLEESPGLHHVAFKIGDSLQELQEAKDWLVNNGVEPDRARDHVATQSVYFFDPDGNQIELFVEGNPKIWLENPSAVANSNPLELKWEQALRQKWNLSILAQHGKAIEVLDDNA